MNSLLRRSANLGSFGLLVSAVTIFVVVVLGLSFMAPRFYFSLARIDISASAQNAGPPFGLDHMQAAFERLTSDRVLNAVSTELNLSSRFMEIYGRSSQERTMSPSLAASDLDLKQRFPAAYAVPDTTRTLKELIHLRQSRNSSMVEVGVLSRDKELSSDIANALVKAFQREHPNYEAELVDAAQPASRFAWPNIPLFAVTGAVVTVLMAVMLRPILRLILRLRVAREE